MEGAYAVTEVIENQRDGGNAVSEFELKFWFPFQKERSPTEPFIEYYDDLFFYNKIC